MAVSSNITICAKKEGPHRVTGAIPGFSPTRDRGMTGGTKERLSFSGSGVIVPRKRQQPHAGIAPVTRCGPSFFAHIVILDDTAMLG